MMHKPMLMILMSFFFVGIILVKFQVKKKQFFLNFLTIVLFGVVGTLISFSIISLGAINFFKKMNIGSLKIGDYFAIGAIFSAIDSVCSLQAGLLSAHIIKRLYFGSGEVVISEDNRN